MMLGGLGWRRIAAVYGWAKATVRRTLAADVHKQLILNRELVPENHRPALMR
ncbi:hypothetical protein KCP74_20195 [Salmonella enterica subsp. enterica]|nr:hypothetical protein KCP74_20195 [Salmonella enterica subsp. enterica]